MPKLHDAFRPSERVLVIGLDGGTFDVLEPLSQNGTMPNLAKLLGTSARAVLESTDPYLTPTAWTTFLTGVDPGRHGILDYRYFDHEQGKVLMNHAGRVDCPTLFDGVGRAGGEMVSLNLPMTYPPRSSWPGIVVGGLDSPSIEEALAHSPEFARWLKLLGVQYDLNCIWRQKPASYEELAENIRKTSAVFHGRAIAAKLADRLVAWKLMVVQFQTLDPLQHYCWPFLNAGPATGGPQRWIVKTSEALWALDQSIGELLELAELRRAAVVAVSDHGFGSFRQQISLPELLRRRGLIEPPPLGTRLGFFAHRVSRNLRKWLHRKRHPGRSTASIAHQCAGVVPIDWRRSRAVTLHGNLAGLVYLNTPQRFGIGPVSTANSYDQTAAEVIAGLVEARHPQTDEPLFEDVFRTDERYGADPLERRLPDVVAIPSPGFHTRTRYDVSRRLLRDEPGLTATHRRQGLMVVQAPGVLAGRLPNVHLRDMAPTILALLGLPAEAGMQGRVLTELFAGAAPPTVAPRIDSPHAPRGRHYTSTQQAAIETRLQALGYME